MADGSDYARVTRTDPSAALRTELVWPGKRTQVERVALPFQVVETVNQSRATREQTPMFAQADSNPFLSGSPVDGGTLRRGWTNKLIWDENKYVLASFLHGDPSIGLEPLAGKVNLAEVQEGAGALLRRGIGRAETDAAARSRMPE